MPRNQKGKWLIHFFQGFWRLLSWKKIKSDQEVQRDNFGYWLLENKYQIQSLNLFNSFSSAFLNYVISYIFSSFFVE